MKAFQGRSIKHDGKPKNLEVAINKPFLLGSIACQVPVKVFVGNLSPGSKIKMSGMEMIMVTFQRILSALGPPTDPERDPKISVGMRPYFSFVRDEICLANKAFILVRRAALKKLIENDYNRYMKELRKYDSAITNTQP